MDISLFDFELPEELIAQSPAAKRDESRLLVIDKDQKTYEDKVFHDIIDYLRPGDVLVRNNTKVLPARLFGVKEGTGAHVEVLLLKQIEGDTWECLTGNAKAIKVGSVISFKDGLLKAECVGRKDEGIRLMKFIYKGIFLEILNEVGNMPLPPYIKKQCADNSRYQTVYAKVLGSAAAPTAGFHFTQELLDKIREKGIEILDVTLHIGLGTFKPVKEQKVEDHVMHTEHYEMSAEVAQKLNQAKKEGRRIIAVGTTATRTLEAIMQKHGKFVETSDDTAIFIKPGYEFKAIDCLITNFHLPKSTLIMLVSALIGREFCLEAYCHAVGERYRFFSFGDSMFIHGK
ncbi:MAG: tRNA preQ1(34) S-adenosylmethionine ribosyltransferase-isomerase QueA [Bacilli bacterium]|nr:tRNA preQ1(34) S-adenosylmethionine ribosyltransferase-isomerase QueA [Bacilli bacterium]